LGNSESESQQTTSHINRWKSWVQRQELWIAGNSYRTERRKTLRSVQCLEYCFINLTGDPL